MNTIHATYPRSESGFINNPTRYYCSNSSKQYWQSFNEQQAQNNAFRIADKYSEFNNHYSPNCKDIIYKAFMGVVKSKTMLMVSIETGISISYISKVLKELCSKKLAKLLFKAKCKVSGKTSGFYSTSKCLMIKCYAAQ